MTRRTYSMAIAFVFATTLHTPSADALIVGTNDCAAIVNPQLGAFSCDGTITVSGGEFLDIQGNLTLTGDLLLLDAGTHVQIGVDPIAGGNLNAGGEVNIGAGAKLTFVGDRTASIGGRLFVEAGASMILKSATTAISLHVGSAEIWGDIPLDGLGFPSDAGDGAGAVASRNGSGAGHAGAGGSGVLPGGDPYGVSTAPVTLGSGGGTATNSVRPSLPGGAGGGAVNIVSTGQLLLNGTISCNGLSSNYGYLRYPGGGSGGSIWIESGSFAGGGSLSAQGGASYNTGGAGAGGYITVYTGSSSYIGSFDVAAGGGGNPAEPGLAMLTVQLANGQQCAVGNQCLSGICSADGFCCDALCGGTCESCNVAGLKGTCSPVPAGQDLNNDCGVGDACAATCDGNFACGAFPTATVSCGECQVCDGAGFCSDDLNGSTCGPLGNSTSQCVGGVCSIKNCDVGWNDCDVVSSNGCEKNTLSDSSHCGGCNVACPGVNGTASCTNGICSISCDSVWKDCDGVAANGCEQSLATLSNCGECDTLCSASNATTDCAGGICTVGTCQSGWSDCDDLVQNGCEIYTNQDPDNCGWCGTICADKTNAVAACNAGACSLTCVGLFGDCNLDPGDGCELPVDADIANCGGCGVVCSTVHATPSCAAGLCAIGCDADWADCDASAGNGCETSTTSNDHCGSCNGVCAPPNGTGSCATGSCVIVACDPGWADCDSLASNGCEASIATSGDHCGACDVACPVKSNAVASCSAGSCGYACAGSFDNCNSDMNDGCEIDLSASANHCGACGAPCADAANAAGICVASACSFACNAPFIDCNGGGADGCEVNGLTDLANCGVCGNACVANNSVPSCAAGSCTHVCGADWGDCNGDVADGCETALLTPTNCGTCGVPCAPYNATGSCTTGTCVLVGCNAGFANCNGIVSDGCEVDKMTDALHCGGCNVECPAAAGATATCVGAVCSLNCNAAFADCDSDPANGCEVSLDTDTENCGSCGFSCGLAKYCVVGFCDDRPPELVSVVLGMTEDEQTLGSTYHDGPVAGRAELKVLLSAASSLVPPGDSITDYVWDFGDDTLLRRGANIIEITHRYRWPGGHRIHLEVATASGGFAESELAVLVKDSFGRVPPQVDAVAVPSQLGVGEEVRFAATMIPGDSEIVAVSWDLADGTAAHDAVLRHTFTEPGVYIVRVDVVDGNSLVAQDFVAVEVWSAQDAEPPRVKLYAEPPAGDVDSSTKTLTVDLFCDARGNTGASPIFEWDFGDQSDTAGAIGPSLSHDYLIGAQGENSYIARCTVSNGEIGSSDEVTIELTEAGVFSPRIVTMPVTDACAEQSYLYGNSQRVAARGSAPMLWEFGKEVGGEIIGKPVGMSVESTTGRVDWTPNADQVGVHRVVFRATNIAGTDTHEFEIEVQDCGGLSDEPGFEPVSTCGCRGAGGGFSLMLLFAAQWIARRKRIRC